MDLDSPLIEEEENEQKALDEATVDFENRICPDVIGRRKWGCQVGFHCDDSVINWTLGLLTEASSSPIGISKPFNEDARFVLCYLTSHTA